VNSVWSELSYAGVTEDDAGLTTDVLQDELQITPRFSWLNSDFVGWQILRAGGVAHADSIEVEELVPPSQDQNFPATSRSVFITKGKVSVIVVIPAATMGPFGEAEWERISSLPTFHPDFFNIKRWARYLLGLMRKPQIGIADEFVRTIPIDISAQAIGEAEKDGLAGDIKLVMEAAKNCYSTLKRAALELEYDPEIPNSKTFRLTLILSGDADVILNDESSFKQELRNCVSFRFLELITIRYDWRV